LDDVKYPKYVIFVVLTVRSEGVLSIYLRLRWISYYQV